MKYESYTRFFFISQRAWAKQEKSLDYFQEKLEQVQI